MNELLSCYARRKKDIRNRLREFGDIFRRSDNDIFAELCFCILTPQAKAWVCDRAIKNLKKESLLLRGCRRAITPYLKGVRFPNNKAKYIIAARKIFRDGKHIKIKPKIDKDDIFKTRDWFARNIKGIGYKEASHFLRNIGLGHNLAILDRHILKNLKSIGIIKKIPRSLTKREYLKIEERMRKFFRKMNITIEEADLLFWSKETGIIFK